VKLPNLDRLIVEQEKVADYLLNPTHRYGASKARFFNELGFQRENWEILVEALREHARTSDIVRPPRPVSGPAS